MQAMSKLDELLDLGQSVWVDQLSREMIESGELEQLIERGVRGVTSNPSIFESAMTHSDSYAPQLKDLVDKGKDLKGIYESVVFKDIQDAADLLRDVYNRSEQGDGFVSLEASPDLAHDTQGTLQEIRHFHKMVDRPNVMFKVPATEEGYPAIEELTAEGININITLMFSLEQYDKVSEAYLSGLEKFIESGGNPGQVYSVASFFVSRVDTKVDERLSQLGQPELKGKIAIANAKMAYQRFLETFRGERWQRLALKGAHLQRVLWGSTSTKNPDYPDTMYVDNLIGPNTINTVPPHTLEAFLDHGALSLSLQQGVDQAREDLEQLEKVGVDLKQVIEELVVEGIQKFADSYYALLDSLEEACEEQRKSGERKVTAG